MVVSRAAMNMYVDVFVETCFHFNLEVLPGCMASIVPWLHSTAVIKNVLTKAMEGRKGFFWLTVPSYSSVWWGKAKAAGT